MMGIGYLRTVPRLKILCADLAPIHVIRPQAVCQVLVAHELLHGNNSFRHGMEYGDAIMIVNGSESWFTSKLLGHLRNRNELPCGFRSFSECPLDVRQNESLIPWFDEARIRLPLVTL